MVVSIFRKVRPLCSGGVHDVASENDVVPPSLCAAGALVYILGIRGFSFK